MRSVAGSVAGSVAAAASASRRWVELHGRLARRTSASVPLLAGSSFGALEQRRMLAIGRGRKSTNRNFDFQKQIHKKKNEKKRVMNSNIEADQVNLIGMDGKPEGTVSLKHALNKAMKIRGEIGKNVDLVQVSNSSPPICRIMVTEANDPAKDEMVIIAKAEKKMKSLKIIRLRQQIDKHDLLNKIANASKQLQKGHPVKITFQGKIDQNSAGHRNIIDTINERLISAEIGHTLIKEKQLYVQPFLLLSPFTLTAENTADQQSDINDEKGDFEQDSHASEDGNTELKGSN